MVVGGISAWKLRPLFIARVIAPSADQKWRNPQLISKINVTIRQQSGHFIYKLSGNIGNILEYLLLR